MGSTGTFELDGQLFPTDPLKKRWSRNKTDDGGLGEPGFAHIWALTFQFPTMEVTAQSSFFYTKFVAGGLHTIKCVAHDSENGELATYTGVTIVNYSYSIPPTDNQKWAQNPTMTLSVDIRATGTT
jgi:hypothetical protein